MSTKDERSEHARALGELGAAKGGKARAKALTPEQRKEIAQYAAERRWEASRASLPRETHPGTLRVGDMEIPCSVLDNGIRVFSTRGVSRVVGSRSKGLKEAPTTERQGAPQLPPFLASSAIRAFIPNDLMAPLISPIQFKPKHGGRTAYGLEATLLPKICGVILDAQKAGVLRASQQHLAERAGQLLRGFAHVGIIALVDEATGYQADRAKDELIKILEAYISKELLPWTKRFPPEFFEEIYRLQGWQFREGHLRGPRFVGKLINQLVYEKLPPGVLPELQRKNPTTDTGYRRHKHHQFLTQDTGHPHLDKQVTAVMTLMRASEDKATFKRLFDRAFPQKGQQLPLNLASNEE